MNNFVPSVKCADDCGASISDLESCRLGAVEISLVFKLSFVAMRQFSSSLGSTVGTFSNPFRVPFCRESKIVLSIRKRHFFLSYC